MAAAVSSKKIKKNALANLTYLKKKNGPTSYIFLNFVPYFE